MSTSLVSVVVSTYNSSLYVIEALESVKAQSYQNIELIIGDDASNDNTVEMCQEWLSKNEGRFLRTQLITVPENTGVVANFNRGLSAAKGEWIKYCAGDDAQLPNCIEDNFNYISEKQDVKALFSYCRMYLRDMTEDCFIRLNPDMTPSHIIADEITAEDQYKLLLVGNRIPFTPSIFLHTNTLRQCGKLDESFPYAEDYQLWLSLTKSGVKLNFMEKETVKYRIHNESLTRQTEDLVVNPVYFTNEASAKKFCYPNIPWDLRLSRMHSWYMNQIFRSAFFNKKNKFNLSLSFFLNKLINPFYYIVYFKTHFFKKYQDDKYYM